MPYSKSLFYLLLLVSLDCVGQTSECETCILKDGKYYWLSRDYCNFFNNDTFGKKGMSSGKELSKFQVLFHKGNMNFQEMTA